MTAFIRFAVSAALALSVAGCFDVEQHLKFTDTGEAEIDIHVRIERKGWDMLSAEDQKEYLCGEDETRTRPGFVITGHGVTELEFQQCYYKIHVSNLAEVPPDFPLQVRQDGDYREITMGTLARPDGKPLNNMQRTLYAGHNWTLKISGEIYKTTGKMTDDNATTYTFFPMVEVMASETPLGLRAWIY